MKNNNKDYSIKTHLSLIRPCCTPPTASLIAAQISSRDVYAKQTFRNALKAFHANGCKMLIWPPCGVSTSMHYIRHCQIPKNLVTVVLQASVAFAHPTPLHGQRYQLIMVLGESDSLCYDFQHILGQQAEVTQHSNAHAMLLQHVSVWKQHEATMLELLNGFDLFDSTMVHTAETQDSHMQK